MTLANTSSYQVGDGNPAEVQIKAQSPAVSYAAAAAPLLVTDLVNGIILYTGGAVANLQLPLATDLDAALPNTRAGASFDFSVVTTGGFAPTVTTNTGWTLVGAMTVAAALAFRFRVLKTAAGAWTLYQLS